MNALGSDSMGNQRKENLRRHHRVVHISGNQDLKPSGVEELLKEILSKVKCEITSVDRCDDGFVAHVEYPSKNAVAKGEGEVRCYSSKTLKDTKNSIRMWIKDEQSDSKINSDEESFLARRETLIKEALASHSAVKTSFKKRTELLNEKLENIEDLIRQKITHCSGKEIQDLADEKHALMQERDLLDQRKSTCVSRLLRVIFELEKLEFSSQALSKLEEYRKELFHEKNSYDKGFPIYAFRDRILEDFKSNEVIVLTAETGSGKSTQLIQYLYLSGLVPGKIVCSQPRKIAAKTLAQYVATEMGCNVGSLVGYNCGVQKKMSSSTRILFATDTVLLNQINGDPLLDQYACVILDEAHERSLNTDILLGLVKRGLYNRKDFKVVVTSATIKPDMFLTFFSDHSVQSIKIPGSCHPVEVIWGSHGTDLIANYIPGLIDLVLKVISEDGGTGDILVFLATPADAETACQMLNDMSLKNVIITVLHGRISPSDQSKVFNLTPRGKRKIVCATNSAETSITIPGVRYVIDSGVVKRKRLDSSRRVSSLVLELLSKSSADQRKGRAGRTCPGKCFRLYSEECFKQLDSSDDPEILKVELSKTCLRLLQLGLDPLTFKYLTSPSEVALKNALEELHFLDALDANGITLSGEKLISLPVEPRLGKPILIAQAKGAPVLETVVIAAIVSGNRDVFVRGNLPEDITEQQRVFWANENGDLITFLDVFKMWWKKQSDAERKKWCSENSISHNILSKAREVLRQMPFEVKHEFINSDDIPKYLRKLFMYCFGRQLCIFPYDQQVGLTAGDSHFITEVYPSTSVAYFENSQFKYAYYSHEFQGFDSFILAVTPVDEAWVQEELIKTKKLESTDKLPPLMGKVLPFRIGDVILLRHFLGYRHEKRRRIEADLKESLDCCVKLRFSVEEGTVTVICLEEHLERIEKYLVDVFEKAKGSLNAKCRIFPVLRDIDVSDSGTLSISAGFVINQLRLPGEYCDIRVSAKEGSSVNELLDQVINWTSFHPRRRKPKFTEIKCGLLIECDSPSLANSIAANIDADMFHVESVINPPKDFAIQGIIVNCRWTRRPQLGFGKCFFQDCRDSYVALMKLSGGIKSASKVDEQEEVIGRAELHIGKDGNPYLRLIDLAPGRHYLDLRRALKMQLPEFRIQKVWMEKSKSSKTTVSNFNDMLGKMKFSLESEIGELQYKVRLQRPLMSHDDWRCQLEFKTVEDAKVAIRKLDNKSFPFTQEALLVTSPCLSRKRTCTDRIFEAIKKDLFTSIRSINKMPDQCTSELIDVKQGEDGKHVISINADTLEEFEQCWNIVCPLIEGCLIPITDRAAYEALMTRAGYVSMQEISKSTNTCVILEYSNGIRVHGGRRELEEAREKCERLVHDLENGKDIHLIQLKHFGKTGLLKALITHYGFNLTKLAERVCVDIKIKIDVKQHELVFTSSDKHFDQVKSLIEECAKTVKNGARVDQPSPEKCPKCANWIRPSRDTYRLQLCGHLYCRPCLREFLETTQIPVICIEEGCDTPYVMEDFKRLVFDSDPLMESLLQRAMDHAVQKDDSLWRCQVTGCSGIVRVNPRSPCPFCDAYTV